MKVGISRFIIVAAIAVLVLAGATTAVAQSPAFSDFSSTANLTLNGNAAAPVNNGTVNVLRLTPGVPHQAGSAWFNIQQPVAGGFTTVFKFQFTQGSDIPADGIAFVIQHSTSGLSALGQDGGSIGYADGGGYCNGDEIPPPCGGIPNSLAVEFDTFDNDGATADPNANHIAVQSCGLSDGVPQPNSPAHGENNLGFPVCLIGELASPSPTMSDGGVHTVIIDYTPATNCEGTCLGTLTVNLDGTNVLTTSVTIEQELNLNEGGTAWVGFTSATGDLFENHDILSWTFTPHTSTSVNRITVPPGGTGVASFGSFNYKVNNTTSETMIFSVEAIPLLPNTSFGPNFPTAQCIVYDGTGGNCWEFEATCISGGCLPPNDFPLATSYDATGPFPSPGFLKGASCGTPFLTNQITAFYVQRQDPTTKGTSGGGLSCWVATKNTDGVAAFNFIGFSSPITNDGLNLAKAGQTIPIKFQVTNANGPVTTLSLSPPGTVVINSAPVSCDDIDVAFVDTLPATTSGASGFQNQGGGFYQYNWQTKGIAAGTCRLLQVDVGDHTIHTALFKFK